MKKLYLDLEGTIIQGFNNPTLLNVEIISHYLSKNKFDSITIFSTAIIDQKDKQIFINNIQEKIEHALNTKIDIILSMEDITTQINTSLAIDCQPSLLSSLYPKKKIFQMYISSVLDIDTTHTLIDDAIGRDISSGVIQGQTYLLVPVQTLPKNINSLKLK